MTNPDNVGGSREAAMVVVKRDDAGVPTVWCDPEIVDLVTALNSGGVRTVWSCSGHGDQFGIIGLADGRQLMILPDLDAARRMKLKEAELCRAAPAGGDVPWRCFHCDEVFTTGEAAALHFGTREYQTPGCQIDVAAYREMEALQLRYLDEDADVHRAMYRMQSEHQQALRRAEEDGYAKGVRDAEKDAAPAGSGEVDALVDELILAARANARSASSQGFEMTEAIHLSYEVNFRQIRALLRKLQQGADYETPSIECYSYDGDQWFDAPDDVELVAGRRAGDTFELMVSHYSIQRKYVVKKAPDCFGDDYEVEPVRAASQGQEGGTNG